jgi:hypothetical protein
MYKMTKPHLAKLAKLEAARIARNGVSVADYDERIAASRAADKAMPKYAYEFGKRWHAETPRSSIKYKASRLHVTELKLLLDMIDEHIERSPDKAKFTKTIRNECHRYAALCMEENMALYRKVVSGRL